MCETFTPRRVVHQLAKVLGTPTDRTFLVDLTGHYLNSILERRTVELQQKTAELEALAVVQYE